MTVESKRSFSYQYLALGCVLVVAGCGGGVGSGGSGTPPVVSTGPASGTEFLYQVTYSDLAGDISVSSFDPSSGAVGTIANVTGQFVPLRLGIDTPSPMVPPSAKYIYGPGQPEYGNEQGIYCASITGSAGQLTPIAEPYLPVNPFFQITSARMDGQGRFIYVEDVSSNETTSAIRSFAINPDDGSLTEGPPTAQQSSGGNALIAGTDLAGKYVYTWSATALGWDLQAYAIDQTNGSLTQVTGSPYVLFATQDLDVSIANPLGLGVDPAGKYVYVPMAGSDANQVNYSETLVFSVDPETGALAPVTGSPFPLPNFQGTGPVMLDPDGKVLYVVGFNNAGTTGVGAYPVDPMSGSVTSTLAFTPVTHCCEAIMMDPAGKNLMAFENQPQIDLNQNYVPNIYTFAVDETTGALGAELTTQGGAGVSGVIVKIP
jgi:6-phosphogluconolactonase (cycloisomerase 2 family)